MPFKPVMKKAARPAARLVTTMVDHAIGPRLSALEHAHGETWLDVQALKGDLPAALDGLRVSRQALEQARASTQAELDELKVSVAAVLDAVSRQHGFTRAAVKAERRLQEQAERLDERLSALETRTEMLGRELLELQYRSDGDGAPRPVRDAPTVPSPVPPEVWGPAGSETTTAG